MTDGICPICTRDKSLSLAISSLRDFTKVESFHICLSPVPQIGPSCGIAALASALSASTLRTNSNFSGATFSNLLSIAKDNSWSCSGEMFDAANLANIAVYARPDITAEVIVLDNDLEAARNMVLFHLYHNRPVLIAYDCDADFYPRKAAGHKAHWAVLNGFSVGMTGKCALARDKENFVNLNSVDSDAVTELYQRACNSSEGTVFFWMLQGKSRLFRSFEAFSLLASNFQLREADPSLLTLGYCIPENGDISASLSHRTLLLTNLPTSGMETDGSLAICSITDDTKQRIKRVRCSKGGKAIALIMKAIKSSYSIEVEEELNDCTIEDLRKALPETQPRFVFLSFTRRHDDGRLSYPLGLILSNPAGCPHELCMMYAGSLQTVMKETGIPKIVQVRDLEDEMNEEFLMSRMVVGR